MDNSRNIDRIKAKRACCELEVEGFRIVEESIEIGGNLFIEIAWQEPPSAISSSYEDLLSLYVALARRCLKRAGLDVEPIPVGRRLLVRVSKKRNRVGRPREDRELVQQVRSLRDAGCTWSEIAKRIQKLTGTRRTPDSYRKLLDRT